MLAGCYGAVLGFAVDEAAEAGRPLLGTMTS